MKSTHQIYSTLSTKYQGIMPKSPYELRRLQRQSDLYLARLKAKQELDFQMERLYEACGL